MKAALGSIEEADDIVQDTMALLRRQRAQDKIKERERHESEQQAQLIANYNKEVDESNATTSKSTNRSPKKTRDQLLEEDFDELTEEMSDSEEEESDAEDNDGFRFSDDEFDALPATSNLIDS